MRGRAARRAGSGCTREDRKASRTGVYGGIPSLHGGLSSPGSGPRRPGFRIVHFSIQGNHVHLIVEADGTRTLGSAVRALSIRMARRLNAMMGRSGPVFADRYHAHVLGTPAEVRRAVRYVVGNFASHAARRGERMTERWVDPYSSAAVKVPRVAQGSLFVEPIARAPETWLLRSAGRP